MKASGADRARLRTEYDRMFKVVLAEKRMLLAEKFDSIRERLVLARKHWQLEELQKSADRQTDWIRKQMQKRLDKRITNGIRRLCGLVKDRVFPTKSGEVPNVNFRSGSKAA